MTGAGWATPASWLARLPLGRILIYIYIVAITALDPLQMLSLLTVSSRVPEKRKWRFKIPALVGDSAPDSAPA